MYKQNSIRVALSSHSIENILKGRIKLNQLVLPYSGVKVIRSIKNK